MLTARGTLESTFALYRIIAKTQPPPPQHEMNLTKSEAKDPSKQETVQEHIDMHKCSSTKKSFLVLGNQHEARVNKVTRPVATCHAKQSPFYSSDPSFFHPRIAHPSNPRCQPPTRLTDGGQMGRKLWIPHLHCPGSFGGLRRCAFGRARPPRWSTPPPRPGPSAPWPRCRGAMGAVS